MTKLEATIADLRIAASMTEPHDSMDIPRVRVVELLDEVERLRAIERRARQVTVSCAGDPREDASRWILGD